MSAPVVVHDRDNDDSKFILVRGRFPVYELAGWIFGREAKKERFIFVGDKRGGLPAYFVPASKLRTMETI